MFDELFEIAKNQLKNIDEIVDGLPHPQVTVLFTDNNNFYVAVNDVDGLICEKLKANKDTKIVRMLTMWKEFGIDLSSFDFRNALIELDEYNYDADIILQGRDGYTIKKLSVTMPTTCQRSSANLRGDSVN